MRKSKRHPDIRPTHPGEIVADAIVELGLTKIALAQALGISRQTLHDLLIEKHGVTASMAVRLEAVLGSSAEFWFNMQAAHELWNARKSVDTSGLKRVTEPA